MKLLLISKVHIIWTLFLILSKSKVTSGWGIVSDAVNWVGSTVTNVVEAVADEVNDAADLAAKTYESVSHEVTAAASISGESIQFVVGEAAQATEDFAETGLDNVVSVVEEGIKVVETVADFVSDTVDDVIAEIADLFECLSKLAPVSAASALDVNFNLAALTFSLTYNTNNQDFSMDRNLRQGEQDEPDGIHVTVNPAHIFEMDGDIGGNDIVSDGNEFENRTSIDDHILARISNTKTFQTACNAVTTCTGGVAALIGTIIEISPVIGADFNGKDKSMTITGEFKTSVSTGVTIQAGGACVYEKEYYFPKVPKTLGTACYMGMCVMVLAQGRVAMKIQGSFLGEGRAVAGIEFSIEGSATIDLDDPDDLSASFEVNQPEAGWKVAAYGEMMTGVTLEGGVILSVMVTPGIVVNAYPYVKLETTLFGSMYYSEKSGNAPDFLDKPGRKCLTSTTSKSSYSKKTTSNIDSTKSFSTQSDFDSNGACVAVGQSLRAGIEISAGGLPTGMVNALSSSNVDLADSMVESFCEEFITSAFPGALGDQVTAAMGSASCLSDALHVPDFVGETTNAACKVVLDLLVGVATAINIGGLHIPLVFPNGKDCFDLFKVSAGMDSCKNSVGCDGLPRGTARYYPAANTNIRDWTSATGYKSYFSKLAWISGAEAYFCGVSSEFSNNNKDRIFRFKYCRPGEKYGQDSKHYTAWTGYKGKWSKECTGNSFIRRIESSYSNNYQDRKFRFQCSNLKNWRKSATCGWSNNGNYVNSSREAFTFSCGENKAMVAFASEYLNYYKDRKFTFKCCLFKKKGTTEKEQPTDYVNDWNGAFEQWAEVDGGLIGALSGVSSKHDNYHEDRRFKFRFSIPEGHPSGAVLKRWLGWTDNDAHWTKRCWGSNWFLIIIKSVHSNNYQDRTFQTGCGQFAGVTKEDCEWDSDWVNSWDGGFTYDCGENKALAGIESYHDNHREDRRFKFQCCLMNYKQF